MFTFQVVVESCWDCYFTWVLSNKRRETAVYTKHRKWIFHVL